MRWYFQTSSYKVGQKLMRKLRKNLRFFHCSPKVFVPEKWGISVVDMDSKRISPSEYEYSETLWFPQFTITEIRHLGCDESDVDND